MHDVCVESALPALSYSFAVNDQVMIQKPRSMCNGLAYEHNTRLSILLRNRLRPATLIVDCQVGALLGNEGYATFGEQPLAVAGYFSGNCAVPVEDGAEYIE